MQTFAEKFPDKLLKALLKYESAINGMKGSYQKIPKMHSEI